jgi:hypothetical protein
MWASDIGGRALVTVLWEVATIGFMAAGAGLLGVPPLQRWWRALTVIAAAGSFLLLLIYNHPLFNPGIAANVVFTTLALAPSVGQSFITSARAGRFARLTLLGLIAYTAIAIAMRPWHSSWGATRSEQQMILASDPPIGESHYRIDHAITISAPVDSVWTLITRVGQGRNARQIEPGRVMVVEGGGSFVLEPAGTEATRLHVRKRGAGIPTLAGIAVTPLAVLVIEPAHFIAERAMMLGIKRRAESGIPL